MLEAKTLNIQSYLGEALDKVDRFLENWLVEQNLPGGSAAIIFDQEVIWSKGFGYADLEKKTPSTPQTLYRVGSITKLFTATMLMQLRDAGKLQLDDPIEKYLPTFKLKSKFANTRPPTFREVVAHMGGIPREAPLDYWYTQKFPTIEEIMASLDQTELTFPPMTEFKYSNLGIAVLGHALETIAGQPYREYVKEHVLQPLGMQASDFELDPETEKQMATGYALEPGKAPEAVGQPSISGFIYAGQLISSVSEMASFISLQFRDAPHDSSESEVLSSSSLREMHAPVFINPDWKSGKGIGWAIEHTDNYTAIGHGGSVTGFNSSIELIPELKLGVALFVNAYANPWLTTINILDLLTPSVKKWRDQEEASHEPGLPDDVARYQGNYYFYGVDRLEVQLRDSKLIGVFPKAPGTETTFSFEYQTPGKTAFRMKGGSVNGELAVFELDQDGEISLVRLGSYVYERK